MSQIPRSQQLALKKKSNIEGTKKQTNGSSNGHSQQQDKDVIIIDDEYMAIPVGREEVIEDFSIPSKPLVEDVSPNKKKRGRKPKFSTESRDSDASETSKRSETQSEISELFKEIAGENLTPEQSPKQEPEVKLKRKTRLEQLQNASTIVNLSTDSQSTSQSDDVTLETPSKIIPERRVSGRRSTRPIDDIKYSYRTPDNLNNSMDATTNATIGSDIGASMLETPAKRRAVDSDEVEESPKRSRLDISALFSNFTSPVSILRSKFMRTNIASTPKVGDGNDELNASEISLNGSSELKDVDLNAEEAKEDVNDDLKIIVKPVKKTSCSIM